MKHTLKSLLITSMLTLPSVFATPDNLFGSGANQPPMQDPTVLKL
ncbi:MAG: hypothetical protein Q8R43_02900 [Alphaproteobacteria bacterium]|nr:hypothetical protein [Alphaproteobacteria bacterium]